MKTTAETAGTNCANGGTKVETGLDTNNDGTLQAGEVTATNYVCNGANGSNGTNGTNGQGVPTGGTTGQVLSKINATDYNTQWVTPSGGTTLPSQTGNADKYLKTDGANLSWGSGSGSSLQLLVTKTIAQTTNVGSSLVLPDVVTFESTNNGNAALTGGNTWTSNNTFTVGTGGAGLYLIDVQLVSNLIFGAPMIDMNNSGNSGSSFYGSGAFFSQTGQSPHKGRGQLQKIVYLAAGESFQIRALPSSTVVGVDLQVDGTTSLRIVKLQ